MDFMGEKINRRELLVPFFLPLRGYCTGEADRCVAVIDLTPGARALCGAVLQYCKFTAFTYFVL